MSFIYELEARPTDDGGIVSPSPPPKPPKPPESSRAQSKQVDG